MSNSYTNLGLLLNMPIQGVLSADVLILDSNDTAALATDRIHGGSGVLEGDVRRMLD